MHLEKTFREDSLELRHIAKDHVLWVIRCTLMDEEHIDALIF